MRPKYCLIVLIFLLLPATGAKGQQLLSQLDSIIEQRHHFIAEKEVRINYLKKQIAMEHRHTELLERLNDLYREYYVFKFDSAYVYARKGEELAIRAKNSYYRMLFVIHRTELLGISGLYDEAEQLLSNIDSTGLPSEDDLRFAYHIAVFRHYSYKANFSNDTVYSPRYVNIARNELKKAMEYIHPDNPLYHYYMGEKLIYIDNNKLKARQHYLASLAILPVNSREYAMTCFALSGNYGAYGDKMRQQDYLIRAAMSDILSATMETSALHNLAVELFKRSPQELERADRYINVSMETAQFYNNRLRMVEISQVLPQIVASYQATFKAKNRQLSLGLLFISALVIGLLAASYFILRQNRMLTKRRKALSETNALLSEMNNRQNLLNNQLNELNQQLLDTNRRREGLASVYIDLCARYIDRLGKLKVHVKRKIKTGQTADLLQTLESARLHEDDVALFLNRFDSAFLDLYPTFIDEFNALLRPDEAITPRQKGSLNTELRTFALIRLGVKSTQDIAGLLFHSPQTIYNCRSVVRSKAINRETFEQQVLTIGTIIRP